MRRGLIMSLFATVFISTVIYANCLATMTVYSSEIPAAQLQGAKPAAEPVKTITEPVAEQKPAIAIATAAQPVKRQTPVIKGNSLSIPSIGFQGSIVDVGVTATNAIDVPGSQVGRWVGSSTPGTPGAVFLDGHVDGVFVRLNRVSVGQIVSLSYAGQTFNYKVVFTEVVDLATIDMNRSLSVYSGSAEGLNIMTCAGTYTPSAGTYDKRLVVYTVRVN